MIWQDAVLFAGSCVFAIALLPMLFDGSHKPPLLTSVPTACVLYLFAATYLTLGLYMSFAITFFEGVLWTALAVG